MTPPGLGRRQLFLAFTAYLAFVVYGSLIPFQYRDHTLAQALEQFAAIGYLNLGIASRADWIANIVLYVPLAFLGCAWLGGMRETGAAQKLTTIFIVGLCLAVAVAVEFTQIFFSPRTVSLNDLLAETIGTLTGVGVWGIWRGRIAAMREAFSQGGRASVLAAGAAYAMAYLALSLFPYDFIVSAKELAWKLQHGNHGWLIASDCGGWLRCSARLVADGVAVAPLGVLLALALPRLNLPVVFALGAGLGLTLELLQLLLASGTSQGASVLLRGAGLMAGAAVGQVLLRRGPLLLAQLVWRSAAFISLPYAAAVLGLSGWFSTSWLPLDAALERLSGVRFLPFYYHYFSTESAAMASLLAVAAMYTPMGLVVWTWQTMSGRNTRRGAMLAACAALSLAVPVELGKLLVPPKHPDPTNLLIAAAGAVFARGLVAWAGRVLSAQQAEPPVPEHKSFSSRPVRPSTL